MSRGTEGGGEGGAGERVSRGTEGEGREVQGRGWGEQRDRGGGEGGAGERVG